MSGGPAHPDPPTPEGPADSCRVSSGRMSLRTCFDWRVLAVLGLVGLGVLVGAPRLRAAVLPLLLVAACPLSMLAMMWGMRRGMRGSEGGWGASNEPTRPIP
ncbi:MAG: hypothetical protein ACRDIF_01860 [Actinomycetota bacterium]